MRKFINHGLSLGFCMCAALALSACTTASGVDAGNAGAAVTEAGLSVFIGLAEQRLQTNRPDATTALKQLNTLDTEYAAVTFARVAFDTTQAARGIPLDPALAATRSNVDAGYARLRGELAEIIDPG